MNKIFKKFKHHNDNVLFGNLLLNLETYTKAQVQHCQSNIQHLRTSVIHEIEDISKTQKTKLFNTKNQTHILAWITSKIQKRSKQNIRHTLPKLKPILFGITIPCLGSCQLLTSHLKFFLNFYYAKNSEKLTRFFVC